MWVIERGRKQKGWSSEEECTGIGNGGGGGCGAKLLVEEADLYVTGIELSHITFQCCECGVETDFNIKNSPTHLVGYIPIKEHHPLFDK